MPGNQNQLPAFCKVQPQRLQASIPPLPGVGFSLEWHRDSKGTASWRSRGGRAPCRGSLSPLEGDIWGQQEHCGYLQLPLVGVSRGVGVRLADQLHVLPIEKPVAIEPLDSDFWLICRGEAGWESRGEGYGEERGASGKRRGTRREKKVGTKGYGRGSEGKKVGERENIIIPLQSSPSRTREQPQLPPLHLTSTTPSKNSSLAKFYHPTHALMLDLCSLALPQLTYTAR